MKIDTCGYVNLKGQANDDPMENAEFVVGKTKNGWNILIMLMGNAGDMNK